MEGDMSEDRYLHLVRGTCPLPKGAHVVAYCRESGGEEQDRSVTQQVSVVREYCAYHGLVLEQIYIDEAKTASNTEKRNQLNLMLADLRYRFKEIGDRQKRQKQSERSPFGIVFWKSNRLGRDAIETNFIKADLRMRALTIIDLVTPADTGDSATNALVEAFQQWKDERDLDELSENARRGLVDTVTLRDNDPDFRECNPDWPTNDGRYLGVMPGVLPKGFRAERVKIKIRKRKASGEIHTVQRAVPDTESGLWERCYLAWKMRREGKGIKEIMEATRLYENTNSYTTFFKNMIYTGDFKFGGKLYKDFVPALIPREWYEEEQKAVALRARKIKHGEDLFDYEPRRVASRHLLTGLVYCCAVEGEEHRMHGATSSKSADRNAWDYYICSLKKRRKGQCPSKRVSAAALEEAVIQKLLTEVLTRENLRPIADHLATEVATQNSALYERVEALQSRLAEVRSAINKLMDAIEKLGLSPNLQLRLTEREAEERDLLAQIGNFELMVVSPAELPYITDQKLDEFIEAMQVALKGDDVEVAQRAIRAFVAKVVVNDKAGTLFYTFPLSSLTGDGVMPLQGFEPWFSP
jgi:hypothetical protein